MGVEIVLPQPGYGNVRRWPRFRFDVPVRVITQSPSKVVIAQGRGRELNGGGMTVFAGIELGLGNQVGVEFTPPYSGKPIRVRCFVRDRSGYNYGVEFITENDGDYEAVGHLESALKGMATPAGAALSGSR